MRKDIKEIKIHIACGDVYLKGYINIDIKGKKIKKGETNLNETTLNKYFKYSFGSPRREIIVDKKMNLLKQWKFKTDSINQIVMISAIEHFPLKQARFIISEIKRVLKSDGNLIIDFPDIKKTVERYIDKFPRFCMRLVYCNHKDKFSVHHWGYTKETFEQLLGNGWKAIVWKTTVKHNYPMTGCIAIKE